MWPQPVCALPPRAEQPLVASAAGEWGLWRAGPLCSPSHPFTLLAFPPRSRCRGGNPPPLPSPDAKVSIPLPFWCMRCRVQYRSLHTSTLKGAATCQAGGSTQRAQGGEWGWQGAKAAQGPAAGTGLRTAQGVGGVGPGISLCSPSPLFDVARRRLPPPIRMLLRAGALGPASPPVLFKFQPLGFE